MKRAVSLRAFGLVALALASLCGVPVDADARVDTELDAEAHRARPGLVAAEPAGWALAFASDFSDAALPAGCAAFDGPHAGPSATHYRPDDVTVSEGYLRLAIRRRDFAGRPYTSGGVGCFRQVQQYGRYEFRAKAPVGAGLDSYVTLWPAQAGADRDASLVEILARPGDERLYLSNEHGTGESHRDLPGRYSDDFHTYLIEWAPTGYRVFVDGRQELADPRVSTRPKWLGFAISTGDALTGLPDAETRLPAEFQIDWVRVWSYDRSAAGSGPSSAGGGVAPGDSRPARSIADTATAGWSGWLVIAAVASLALALAAVAVRLGRPRRPRSGHRG